MPGKLALKLDKNLLSRLSRQIRYKTVAITGTNGKSTTAGLLAAFIASNHHKVVHNQLGANMLPGITTALLMESSFNGQLQADYGVIEVDEASLPLVAEDIKPDLTVVTNLFRDQLDRYGELDTTAKLIQKGISLGGGYLALNADDPMVTSIGRQFPADQVIYYGVNAARYETAIDLHFPVAFPHEITDCPVCNAPLGYSQILYGHLGHYHCTACDFARPQPWLVAEDIAISATDSRIQLHFQNKALPPVILQLPGLFNAYNLLAAATAGLWLSLPPESLPNSVSQYQSIFGRAEKKQIDGKSILIMLIKNPIGATEVLKVVTADPKARVLICINDNYADGRDISWLWDAPFEYLSQLSVPIVVSGHRAADMALRLHYAGVPESLIDVQPDILSAFRSSVSQTRLDEVLYILPTYTALLEISQHLGSR